MAKSWRRHRRISENHRRLVAVAKAAPKAKINILIGMAAKSMKAKRGKYRHGESVKRQSKIIGEKN
jgi:hypothetical protein